MKFVNVMKSEKFWKVTGFISICVVASIMAIMFIFTSTTNRNLEASLNITQQNLTEKTTALSDKIMTTDETIRELEDELRSSKNTVTSQNNLIKEIKVQVQIHLDSIKGIEDGQLPLGDTTIINKINLIVSNLKGTIDELTEVVNGLNETIVNLEQIIVELRKEVSELTTKRDALQTQIDAIKEILKDEGITTPDIVLG